MTFEFDLDDERKSHVIFSRNWFTGTLRIKVNGILVAWASALNPLTHYSLSLTRAYRINLSGNKESEVIIVAVRPLFFAGFRPHTYSVFWKGVQISQHRGY